MERGQIGKASETEAGDWIEVRSANPNRMREGKRISKGFHYFDVVQGKEETKQKGNSSVRLASHGSISGNTTVKKVGSDLDNDLASIAASAK